MTPSRQFSKNHKFNQGLRKGGLYVAVAALLAAHTACNNSGAGGDWEEVTTYEVTKGVRTTLEEVEPEKFEVVDEQLVEGKEASSVIIKRLSGSIDTLGLKEAQALVSSQDTVSHSNSSGTSHNTYYRGHGYGLGSILYWSAFGHMMGRSFNAPSPYGVYRNPGIGVTDQLRSTSVARTEMRPIRGRSGFFSRSGRSSWGG